MSRLYANTATAAQVVARFDTEPAEPTVPPETVEGGAGVVVLEVSGRRLIKSMTWGFPRRVPGSGRLDEPPQRVGLLADLTNPMWEQLVVDPRYRCLIPLTHFANPAGDAGSKTRTWFSVEGEPLVAWAGFCRNTSKFGPVYAGMTMKANERVMPYNDRMPALLAASEHDRWLHGGIRDVIGFQFRPPIAAALTIVEHTEDRWRSGAPPPSASAQPALI